MPGTAWTVPCPQCGTLIRRLSTRMFQCEVCDVRVQVKARRGEDVTSGLVLSAITRELRLAQLRAMLNAPKAVT